MRSAMIRLLTLLVVLLPSIATAQAVSRTVRPMKPDFVFGIQPSAWSAAVVLGAYGGLETPVTLTKATGIVRIGSGGGASNSVLTVTDGTNTCTFTFSCTTSASLVVMSAAATNGAGTGCNYAAGANLSASVTTAGCTTTQPTFSLVNIVGNRAP